MKKCFVILFCLLSVLAPAQETKAVMQFLPFTAEGVSAEEARIIEVLIQSYIVEIYNTAIYDGSPRTTVRQNSTGAGNEEGGDADVSDALTAPDFIIGGGLVLRDGMKVLRLDISDAKSGEHYVEEFAHRTTSEMALKTRSIVENVFAAGNPRGGFGLHMGEMLPEPFSGASFSGVWRGTDGVEQVRFFPGGTALAVLSSGISMNLSYRIENNTLSVTQTSPNYERFYHPLPLPVARELVRHAEPMRWELSLYDNGNSLKGIKIETAVLYEGDQILEYKPGVVKKTEWQRSLK
jgi:hypothetical protein